VQRAIKKAQKSDLQLKVAADPQDMASFYRLYVQTRKRLELPPMPYRFFETLWKVYGRTEHLQLLFAVHAGRPVAGVMMLTFNGRSILEFIADDGCARQLRPVHFLIWESVQRAHAMGCALLSLGRTPQQNTSLMSFKEHWGTVAVDLQDYYFPPDAAPMRSTKEASVKYRMISTIARKSPNVLFQLLGNFCYRHLG
jgi:CelD/BcsL family acetyltransferase involved in cellulose biosynthesis